MKIIAINGSPRKKDNTATLLEKALEGAANKGAQTKLIHLYDLNYKGCLSCFSCKRLGGKSYGKCAVKDDLFDIFDQIEKADALLLGSPIYFGEITGAMRSFLERLFFQYLVYDKAHTVLFPGKLTTGFIFTMNAPEHFLKEIKYDMKFKVMKVFSNVSSVLLKRLLSLTPGNLQIIPNMKLPVSMSMLKPHAVAMFSP